MQRSDRVVLTSAILTVGSTVGASVLPETMCGHGQLPSPRLLFGATVTFAGLSMLSDFTPSIAIPLAGGIALTAVLYYGIPILDAFVTEKPCAPAPNGRRAAAPTSANAVQAAANPGSGNRPATPTF